MVKVAFVLYNFEVGGTELNAVRTVEALDRGRFDVRVVAFSSEGPLLERYRALGIPIRVFPIRSLLRPHAAWYGLQMARWFRTEGIDVVHTFDLYGNIVGVPCARLAGVPNVIASRRWWKRTVEGRVLKANRFACRLAHHVVGNSEAVGRFLVEEDGVRSKRVSVITNFLEDEAFETPDAEWIGSQRAQLGLAPGDLVVGVVARLVPIKDHASLLRAAATLIPDNPNLKVVLVGDGPERATLEALVAEAGIARNVVFAGQRPQSPSFHHLFDVSALPSLSEGFPNTVLEAMAAGKPVVATRVGGTPDAVVHGETGILVPPSEVEMFAGALGSLVNNPDRRKQMGDAGRSRARAVYSDRRVIPALERLYGEQRGDAAGPCDEAGSTRRAVAEGVL